MRYVGSAVLCVTLVQEEWGKQTPYAQIWEIANQIAHLTSHFQILWSVYKFLFYSKSVLWNYGEMISGYI